MTPLLAVAATLAWALALGWRRRPVWPHYRPVAWLLTWGTASSLLRAAVQAWMLRPARAELGAGVPYAGGARAAFHLEQALFLSWPAALLGGALAVYASPTDSRGLARRAWHAGAFWLVCSAGVAAAYPALAHQPLAYAYASIWSAAWAGCAWRGAVSWLRGDVWISHHIAVGFLMGGTLAAIAVVLWGGAPERDWGYARFGIGLSVLALVCYQTYRVVCRDASL